MFKSLPGNVFIEWIDNGKLQLKKLFNGITSKLFETFSDER